MAEAGLRWGGVGWEGRNLVPVIARVTYYCDRERRLHLHRCESWGAG